MRYAGDYVLKYCSRQFSKSMKIALSIFIVLWSLIIQMPNHFFSSFGPEGRALRLHNKCGYLN